MVVNHLQTHHYHLGLICSCCVEYFTSAGAMHWHAKLCKPVLADIDDNDSDNGWEEESVNDDNGREYDDKFTFYKD